MTYCLGICLEDGLVLASDSRTNAGVDYVTSNSKMHVFQALPGVMWEQHNDSIPAPVTPSNQQQEMRQQPFQQQQQLMT